MRWAAGFLYIIIVFHGQSSIFKFRFPLSISLRSFSFFSRLSCKRWWGFSIEIVVNESMKISSLVVFWSFSTKIQSNEVIFDLCLKRCEMFKYKITAVRWTNSLTYCIDGTSKDLLRKCSPLTELRWRNGISVSIEWYGQCSCTESQTSFFRLQRLDG